MHGLRVIKMDILHAMWLMENVKLEGRKLHI